MIDPKLLEILACPLCKTEVKLVGNPSIADTPSPAGMVPARSECHLVCVQCGRRYPIREGIPVMLIEEAEQSERTPS